MLHPINNFTKESWLQIFSHWQGQPRGLPSSFVLQQNVQYLRTYHRHTFLQRNALNGYAQHVTDNPTCKLHNDFWSSWVIRQILCDVISLRTAWIFNTKEIILKTFPNFKLTHQSCHFPRWSSSRSRCCADKNWKIRYYTILLIWSSYQSNICLSVDLFLLACHFERLFVVSSLKTPWCFSKSGLKWWGLSCVYYWRLHCYYCWNVMRSHNIDQMLPYQERKFQKNSLRAKNLSYNKPSRATVL